MSRHPRRLAPSSFNRQPKALAFPAVRIGAVRIGAVDRRAFVQLLLASLLFLASAPFAFSSDRTSSNMGADAIGHLITRQRLDEADALCQWQLRRSNEGDWNHARWTAARANVLAEKASTALFAANDRSFISQLNALTQKAIGPIEQLLGSYPDSEAELFLRAEQISVRQRILQAAVVASVVSPSTESRTEQLLVMATRIQGDTVRLADEAAQKLREYQAELRQKKPAIADHQRLIHELAVRRISLAVLQTELFQSGTTDYQTSAASAVAIAKDNVLALPDGTLAQWTAKLWHVEALLRLGVATEADRLLQELQKDTPANKESHVRSLQVRSATIQGNYAKAKALASEFYRRVANGAAGSEASLSPEMDFAYLRLLLSDGADQAQLASWIANIEQRGGAYARRRAESITIAALGRSRDAGSNETTPMANPALIAAQAEDLLRKNELQRAAGLLRAAALAESDSNLAFEYAKKSAAASSQDFEYAIETLFQVAVKHAADDTGAELMMQAALLRFETQKANAADSASAADSSHSLLELLGELITSWPHTTLAAKAHQWQLSLLDLSNRTQEAAYRSLEFASLTRRAADIRNAAIRWHAWLASQSFDDATREMKTLVGTFQEIGDEDESASNAINEVGIWLLDLESLSDVPANQATTSDSDALVHIRQFRRAVLPSLDLAGVPPEIRSRLIWRLFRDGHQKAERQQVIGTALKSAEELNPLQSAMAAVWSDPGEASAQRLKSAINSSATRKADLGKAIAFLRSASTPAAKTLAITLLDQLASMEPIGSDAWHQAKLQAIERLKQSGQATEAQKRAKYILLTSPPTDDSIKARYQAAAK